ncbi:MAG: cyclic nucleotide-binding domain-containing protein [Endomicrobium sp.]|jgi:CRP-like cAMP-binding protein|nr:cyclic nucleotide-binding domain-containing protein [Endomicrobium sp.]
MGKIKNILNYLFVDDVLKRDIDFLRQVSIFSHLSHRSLAKIALIVFKKNYAAGEQVYKNRQEANVLYIVKSGEILVKNSMTGKTVGEGDFFGEISLIENRRHDSTATALKDSELYLIYRVKFDDMVDSNAKVGLIIMKNLCLIFEARLKCAEQEQPAAEALLEQDNNDDRSVK